MPSACLLRAKIREARAVVNLGKMNHQIGLISKVVWQASGLSFEVDSECRTL